MGKKDLIFAKNIEALNQDVNTLKDSINNLQTAYHSLEIKSSSYELRIVALEVKSDSDDKKIQDLTSQLEKVRTTKSKKLKNSQRDTKRNEAHQYNEESGEVEHKRKSKSVRCYFCGNVVFTTNGLHRHIMDLHSKSKSLQANFF